MDPEERDPWKAGRRQRDLLRAMERRLNQPGGGAELAGQAFLSRYHFQRVFRLADGEPPGNLRRRLLLERAAYGLSPRAYRRAAQQIRRLPGTSGVHYDPRTRKTTTVLPGGKRNMDLMDRLPESDFASKRLLLECAGLLTDRQLDAPLAFRHNLMPFVEPARTLRESFAHIVWSGWVDMMFAAVGW